MMNKDYVSNRIALNDRISPEYGLYPMTGRRYLNPVKSDCYTSQH